MQKIILIITGFVSVFCISILCYFAIQSNNFSKINNKNNDIKKIEIKIKKINNEIKIKEEKKNEIKNNNAKKVEILEVWEKELEKIKNYS